MKQTALNILLTTLFALSPCFVSMAEGNGERDDHSWQDSYEILLENIGEDEDVPNLTLLFETLSEMAANPVNINTITAEQLQAMFFFSDIQVDAILAFVARYAPLRSQGEMLMIPMLDDSRCALLSALTYFGEVEPNSLREWNFLDSLKYSVAEKNYRRIPSSTHRGELLSSIHIPFYTRKGDTIAYAGSRLKHWTRFQYRINRHMRIGLVAAQDAGEPFFSGKNKLGYDFYSAYFRLQRLGIIDDMVIGRYRMRNAMGLILNNNISFGKSFSSVPASHSSTTIFPHLSKTSSNFLQGVAVTVKLSPALETTVFASCRQIDATLSDDSMFVKTLLSSGYHRTASELQRKNNVQRLSAGTNIRYNFGRWALGATAVLDRFSLPLRPYEPSSGLSQLYRRFRPAGQEFWNASIDYNYRVGKRFSATGETATGGCGAVATINSLVWHPADNLSLSAIQRYFPVRYYSTLGNCFSEGGDNQNENGLYLGATWTANNRLSVSAFTDFARFAWPRYQAFGTSHSFDNMLQATYKLSPKSSLCLRYRIKLCQKDIDISDSQKFLAYKNLQRLRLQHSYHTGRWTIKSQADASFCSHKEQSFGGMLSETIAYSTKPLKITASMSAFHTRDYNSCVYFYEQGMPGEISIPALFGKGLRTHAYAQLTPCKNLTFMATVSFTRYFDRETIGSGYQQIKSNHITDLTIALRWRW